ncbi:hypothetical protein BRPE64_BCDS07840 [Caballeronia insecticola]|uniref:Uncharacterized protein n=1 Tax=Caballeronia insecticola TaxID=758793 RepID=R4WWG6_9BURK|nr:hypothetical protein BRPE64_BCDS07840 [Caballeronia insecticola]
MDADQSASGSWNLGTNIGMPEGKRQQRTFGGAAHRGVGTHNARAIPFGDERREALSVGVITRTKK